MVCTKWLGSWCKHYLMVKTSQTLPPSLPPRLAGFVSWYSWRGEGRSLVCIFFFTGESSGMRIHHADTLPRRKWPANMLGCRVRGRRRASLNQTHVQTTGRQQILAYVISFGASCHLRHILLSGVFEKQLERDKNVHDGGKMYLRILQKQKKIGQTIWESQPRQTKPSGGF